MNGYGCAGSKRAILMMGLAALCLPLAVLFPLHAQFNGQVKKAIVYADLSAEVRAWFEKEGISRDRFTGYIDSINERTAERELDGEYDHLIYFLLQSERFTGRPKIEPALSAAEFVKGLSEAERSKYLAEGSNFIPSSEKVPGAVRARINDFIKAQGEKSDDERLVYFKNLLTRTADSPTPGAFARRLDAEYARAMRFLYRKEFVSRGIEGAQLAAYVASLYEDRGHSTDTQIEANFAVYTALASLKARSPAAQLHQVLIVGPGLDFAPRTALIDRFGPQSYQPFAVADALLSLKLAAPAALRIHCVDINERVIAHIQRLRLKSEATLAIFSGIDDNPRHPLTSDFKEYFRNLGRSLGAETEIEAPPELASHLKKSVKIRRDQLEKITVDRLNIITERYQGTENKVDGNYDLVIVTNVFSYFNPAELLLALTNIAAMMTEGGYLIHNELQKIPSPFIAPLGLPIKEARTVLIASGHGLPLFDGIAIHQKEKHRSGVNGQSSALRN